MAPYWRISFPAGYLPHQQKRTLPLDPSCVWYRPERQKKLLPPTYAFDVVVGVNCRAMGQKNPQTAPIRLSLSSPLCTRKISSSRPTARFASFFSAPNRELRKQPR